MALEQVTGNVFADTGRQGCNFGFLTTSDGIVMFDSPHRPTDAMALKAEIARRGQLRYIINTEPHGDHWTGNSFSTCRSSPRRASGAESWKPIWCSTSSGYLPSGQTNRS